MEDFDFDLKLTALMEDALNSGMSAEEFLNDLRVFGDEVEDDIGDGVYDE